jgi:small subunit ribosomal protein S8
MTDPISDMIIRIKNGIQVQKKEIILPASKIKEGLAKLLVTENYLDSFRKLKKGKKEFLVLTLKYVDDKSAISEIRRVSKPGRRFYVNNKDIPKLSKGFGKIILSTSKGIMTDKKAAEVGVGGEVMFRVW